MTNQPNIYHAHALDNLSKEIKNYIHGKIAGKLCKPEKRNNTNWIQINISPLEIQLLQQQNKQPPQTSNNSITTISHTHNWLTAIADTDTHTLFSHSLSQSVPPTIYSSTWKEIQVNPLMMRAKQILFSRRIVNG